MFVFGISKMLQSNNTFALHKEEKYAQLYKIKAKTPEQKRKRNLERLAKSLNLSEECVWGRNVMQVSKWMLVFEGRGDRSISYYLRPNPKKTDGIPH